VGYYLAAFKNKRCLSKTSAFPIIEIVPKGSTAHGSNRRREESIKEKIIDLWP
jgi:hypothetical protein